MIAFLQFPGRAAFLVKRQYLALEIKRVVTVKGRRRPCIFKRRRHLEFSGGARLFLLSVHCPLETCAINAHAALAADVGGQVEREAESVVQLERRFSIENPLATHRRKFAFENRHAVFDGREEALLFLTQHVGDALLARHQFGVRAAHLGNEIRHHAMEEGRPRTELVAMANGAPDNAAQDVATALVAGDDAIGEQE